MDANLKEAVALDLADLRTSLTQAMASSGL
jgi:hypothetical protein